MIIVARRSFAGLAPVAVHAARLVLGRADEYRVIGMGLDVLLQVLGTLERLSAVVAFVRLQRDVDTDVRGDMITLHRGSSAAVPLARQIEIVGAFTANMTFTDVLVKQFWSAKLQAAGVPATREVILGILTTRRATRSSRRGGSVALGRVALLILGGRHDVRGCWVGAGVWFCRLREDAVFRSLSIA
jgi:hypothetical protein